MRNSRQIPSDIFSDDPEQATTILTDAQSAQVRQNCAPKIVSKPMIIQNFTKTSNKKLIEFFDYKIYFNRFLDFNDIFRKITNQSLSPRDSEQDKYTDEGYKSSGKRQYRENNSQKSNNRYTQLIGHQLINRFQNSLFFVWDINRKVNIYIGSANDLFQGAERMVRLDNCQDWDEIIIKYRFNNEDSEEEYKAEHQSGREIVCEQSCRREKERTIGFAYQQVERWRNIYMNGHTTAQGQNIKVNLDQAAKIVGMSRKTLDDYRLQIQRGDNYGFDFDHHWNDKIGVLRRYNRQMIKREQDYIHSQSGSHYQQQYQPQMNAPNIDLTQEDNQEIDFLNNFEQGTKQEDEQQFAFSEIDINQDHQQNIQFDHQNSFDQYQAQEDNFDLNNIQFPSPTQMSEEEDNTKNHHKDDSF